MKKLVVSLTMILATSSVFAATNGDADYPERTPAPIRGSVLCENLNDIATKAWAGANSVAAAKRVATQYCQTLKGQEELGSNTDLLLKLSHVGNAVAMDGALTLEQRHYGFNLQLSAVSFLQGF